MKRAAFHVWLKNKYISILVPLGSFKTLREMIFFCIFSQMQTATAHTDILCWINHRASECDTPLLSLKCSLSLESSESNQIFRVTIWSEATTGGLKKSVKKDFLRNLAKFTGKHLYQGLLFLKVAGLGLQLH